MKITIHRGIDQIGGCITEIESSNGTKILIDLGHSLPDGDNKVADELDTPSNLSNILKGVSHVFYSHYHGDHIGFEAKIPTEITQHMGELAIKMISILKEHMTHADDLKDDAEASLDALVQFEAYKPYERKQYGDIWITALSVSHSALDAYMFLIECDGRIILHTGDFRDHGYNAQEKLEEIEKFLSKNVDILITEGTMLGRGDKRVMSEEELQEMAITKLGKYNFVMCSSMDIDRIASFFLACRKSKRDMRIIADRYQMEQIKAVKGSLGKPYDELFVYPYGRDMEKEFDRMKRHGFLMFVRDSSTFISRIKETIDKTSLQPSQIKFFYSQFSGYIKPDHKAFKKSLYDFVHQYDWDVVELHTSGHASKEALQRIVEISEPSVAIIPIHKEGKGTFQQLNLSVTCPVIEESCMVDDINIQIK